MKENKKLIKSRFNFKVLATEFAVIYIGFSSISIIVVGFGALIKWWL